MTSTMSHQGGVSTLSTQGPTPEIPISKYLVSHELSSDDLVKSVRKLLASKEGQEGAKSLEPGDVSRFVELIDQVLRAGKLEEYYRPTCTRYLARVCGWHGVIPNSVRIAGHQYETIHGGGGNSEVWIGRYNDQKVVIKMLRFFGIDREAKKRDITREFCKEVVIWKNLNHPNVLPFVGAAMVTEPGREKYEIISEFMENGDIKTFIERNADVNRLELLKDVAAGLSYLHSQRVIHGDLKELNVLINKQRRACLADFGLTRIVAGSMSSDSGEPKGTILWMSPEMIWPERFMAKDARPTMESDVYSLGILIYYVICEHMPFPELGEWAAVNKLQEGKFPDRPSVGFTDSLWRTLESCWQLKREKRPTAEAVLRSLDGALRKWWTSIE